MRAVPTPEIAVTTSISWTTVSGSTYLYLGSTATAGHAVDAITGVFAKSVFVFCSKTSVIALFSI